METERNKKSIVNLKSFNNLNLNRNKKLKPLSLFSSNSNANINFRQINIIPLSRLFKNKLNNISQNNYNNNIEENIKFNSMGKIPNNQYRRNYLNSLNNYNSLSRHKISLVKLPKIKNSNENDDLKGSILGSLLNKFDDYDNKFKEQEKISEFIIHRGDKYLKLKKDYNNYEDEKYKYCASKQNYKKQYSKLYKRIKGIHLV